jgi:hypothetical protein
MTAPTGSDLRFEKRRNTAVVRLTTGETVRGNFFTSAARALQAGPERIGDLLNAESGFFPFERCGEDDLRTVMYNRDYIVTVTVSADEPRQDPGYAVATCRAVSMLLSTGERVAGTIRVYQPAGYSRLSDWSKSRDQFHYLETDASTLLINSAHIVEVSEIPEA